jgi:Mn2+/Fe2+ NRAMP family transporter
MTIRQALRRIPKPGRSTVLHCSGQCRSSANIREHYNRPVAFVFILLLLVANTINIGADIGAIGESLTLLGSGHSLFYSFLITLGTSLLIIFIPYTKYVKILRWLTISLFAYIAVAFIVEIDWLEVS